MAGYKYLSIDDDGEIVISDKRFESNDYAFKALDGSIFPCMIYDAVVLSDELVSIGGMNYYINTLKVVPMESITSLQGQDEDRPSVTKDISSKLPDPTEYKLQPFTSAVITACKMNKPIALTKEEHQNRLTIIRNIKNNSEVEISVRKASELLSYYGLEIQNIIKDEYVVKR